MKRFFLPVLSILFLIGSSNFIAMAGDKVTVNYWSRKAGPDHAIVEKMVDQFNRTHEGIEVKFQVMPWGAAYYSKIRSSILAGSPPEIFDVAVYAPPMFRQYVESFSKQELEEMGINEGNHLWKAMEPVKFDDRYYGISLGMLPLGLYYNKELFAKAGLDPEKPPRNLTEFVEYGKKLTKDIDGNGKIDQWGFMVGKTTNPNLWLWGSILVQNGGSLLNKNKTNAAINSKAGLDALNIMLDFSRKYKISPPMLTDSAASFVAKKVGMFIGGIWMVPSFKTKVPSSASAPLPQFGSESAAAWSSMDIYLFPKGKRKETEKWKAAMAYSKWVAGPEGQKFYAQFFLPTRLETLKSPAIQADPYMSRFASGSANLFFPPAHPATQEIYDITWSAIQGAFAGNLTAEKALAQAEEQANKVLSQK
jgi:multiple sugar transport system substrate-binding protein